MAIVFQSNDAAYVRWRAEHPEGWVANVHQSLGGKYFKVHRARCRKAEEYTHARHAEPLTGGNYAKLVATSLEELCAWRVGRGLAVPAEAMCAFCCAGEAAPDLFVPSADPDRVSRAARLLLDAEVLARPSGNPVPVATASAGMTYATSALVRAWVLRRASGRCELCALPAPFLGRDGEPFLEVHHLTRLADDGPDVVENCAALCPNCHRRLHYASDVQTVVTQVRATIAEIEVTPGEMLTRVP